MDLQDTIEAIGADMAEQIHVPFVGCGRVAGDRPERREAGADEDVCGFDLRQMRTVLQNMRGHDTGIARLAPQFCHKLLCRCAVVIAPGIALVWRDHIPDEALDFLAD